MAKNNTGKKEKVSSVGGKLGLSKSSFIIDNPLSDKKFEEMLMIVERLTKVKDEEEKQRLFFKFQEYIENVVKRKTAQLIPTIASAVENREDSLHVTLNTKHFAINEDELTILEEYTGTIKLNWFIAFVSIFLSFLANLTITYIKIPEPITVFDYEFLINALMSFGALVGMITTWNNWRSENTIFKKTLKKIRKKPKLKI